MAAVQNKLSGFLVLNLLNSCDRARLYGGDVVKNIFIPLWTT